MKLGDHDWLVDLDTDLPGLTDILNLEVVAQQLGTSTCKLSIDYIRYKPKTNALVRYAFGDKLAYAKVFSPDQTDKLVACVAKSAISGDLIPTQIGKHALLYPFPLDAKLKTLSRLSDLPEAQHILSRLNLHQTEIAAMQVLAYKPEKRCVLKTLTKSGTPVVLKIFNNRRTWQRAYQNATMVTHRVPTVQILDKSERHSALVYEFVEGENLRDLLRESDGKTTLTDLGGLLARLHRSRIDVKTQLSRKEELERIQAISCLLQAVQPDHAKEIYQLATDLSNWLRRQATHQVLCHGDFYDKQIVVVDQQPILLDFDEAAAADPRMDVANFAAHRILLGDTRVILSLENLLHGYHKARGQALPELQRYVAVRLFLLSHHPFRAVLPNWQSATAALLHQCRYWFERKEIC